MTTFKQLKDEWMRACHVRHACKDGFGQLVQAGTVAEILETGVSNWDDVYRSKFADFMADNIVRQFTGLEDEFHQAGFCVNEPCSRGIAIVTRPGRTLHFTGRARVYIFAKADVVATDECQVYCRDAESTVELRGQSYGKIEAGRVTVREWATAESRQECWCYDHSTVYALEGIVHDHGHRKLIV